MLPHWVSEYFCFRKKNPRFFSFDRNSVWRFSPQRTSTKDFGLFFSVFRWYTKVHYLLLVAVASLSFVHCFIAKLRGQEKTDYFCSMLTRTFQNNESHLNDQLQWPNSGVAVWIKKRSWRIHRNTRHGCRGLVGGGKRTFKTHHQTQRTSHLSHFCRRQPKRNSFLHLIFLRIRHW